MRAYIQEDRQTDKQTYSSQYLAPLPGEEVIIADPAAFSVAQRIAVWRHPEMNAL